MISLRLQTCSLKLGAIAALNLCLLCATAVTAANPSEVGGQTSIKLQELNLAVQREPRRASAYLNRAHFIAPVDEDNALLDFDKAIQLDPTNYIAYLWRADLLMRMELFARAAKDYTSSGNLSKLPADKTLGYRQAGRADVKAGQSLDGLKMFNQALSFADPLAKPNIYLYRAEAHLALKHYESAIADINSMGKMAEQLELAHSIKASSLVALGRYEAAIPELTEAIKLGALKPSNLEGVVFQHKVAIHLRERAMCLDKLGKKDLAALDRRKADVTEEDSLLNAPFH